MLWPMSSYEPPEIDWQDPYSEWEPPRPPFGQTRTARAVIWLWTTSAIQVFFFGFCIGCLALAVTLVPQDELMSQLTPEQRQALGGMGLDTALLIVFVIAMVLMVVPAIVNILLGFAIRKGSAPARIAAIIILALQALLLAGFLLINLVTSLMQGDIASLFFNTCITGILLALIVVTIFQLVTIPQAQ